MVRVLKLLIFIGLIGCLAFIGYAYLGDMAPERIDVVQPVELNVGD